MALNFSSGTRDITSGGEAPIMRQHGQQQTLFLDRLARLVRKGHLHGRYLVPTDRRMQLLNRAILSTFCDCRELGVETEARAIIAGMHRELPLPLPARDARR